LDEVIAYGFGEILYSGGKGDGLSDGGGASFKLSGRRCIASFLPGYSQNHISSSLIGRELLAPWPAHIHHPNPRRAIELVPRKNEKIHPQPLDIYRLMHNTLTRI
jgi:hypothetical protein